MSATPMTAPVRHCVVDTGRPSPEANKTVTAAPNSTANPRLGDIWVILFPMALMILYPEIVSQTILNLDTSQLTIEPETGTQEETGDH